MRVLDIFMTILVLGTFSSTIGQEEIDDVSNPDNPEVLESRIENSEKEDCVTYGGHNTHSSMRMGFQKLLNCTRPLLNRTEFDADKAAALFNGKWDAVTKKYCQRLPELLQCESDMVDYMKPCLDAEDKGILDSYHNISISLSEFLCQNDGNLLASFVNNGGVQCLTSNVGTIQQDCHLDAIDDQIASAGRTIPWVEVVRKNCTVIEEFGTCTVGVLRTCDNPTPANVIESVFNFFKSRKSCPSISPTQPSPAT